MKTYDQLYETLTSFENLYLDFDEAACGKRGQPNVELSLQPAFRKCAAGTI